MQQTEDGLSRLGWLIDTLRIKGKSPDSLSQPQALPELESLHPAFGGCRYFQTLHAESAELRTSSCRTHAPEPRVEPLNPKPYLGGRQKHPKPAAEVGFNFSYRA